MITARCWWLVDIMCPSRSLPQQSPTTFSWGLSLSTYASSTRAIQLARARCLKVLRWCTETACLKKLQMQIRCSVWSGCVEYFKINSKFSYKLFCCSSDSHWTTFSCHEPPLPSGHKRWVQHCQTPTQPGLHWAATCCQLLAVSTGNLTDHQYVH